jgi:hypothetical protein
MNSERATGNSAEISLVFVRPQLPDEKNYGIELFVLSFAAMMKSFRVSPPAG